MAKNELQVARSTVATTLKNVTIAMLSMAPTSATESVIFLRECLLVAHPNLAPMLLLEGEAEEDGSVIPAAGGIGITGAGEKDPFGISSGQSLMWEAAIMADHVSPEVCEAAAKLLGSFDHF